MTNLLGEPDPTRLPIDPAVAELAAGHSAETVVRAHPTSSATWAVLAERALAADEDVAAYAYARVGYHRGLDQLRRAGWKGHGPIPWEHEPNQGFLRSLHLLSVAAARIGDDEESHRCAQFLADSSQSAVIALNG